MKVLDRFLNYVSFSTASDESSDTVPSTERQRALAARIAHELEVMGLSDVAVVSAMFTPIFPPRQGERETRP